MDKLEEMHLRDNIRSFVPNDKNIEGIFNYCNRWCERCQYTDRCTQFEMQDRTPNNGVGDLSSSIEYVGIMLQESLLALQKMLDNRGLDIDHLPELEMTCTSYDKPLETLSREYYMLVSQWLNENAEALESRCQYMLNISIERAHQLSDAIKVVQWNMSLIPAKISRALGGKILMIDEIEIDDKTPTAKLVLVCIEESMLAFKYVMTNWSEKEDDVFPFLVTLSKLRSGILQEIPKAQDFKRPYLDD